MRCRSQASWIFALLVGCATTAEPPPAVPIQAPREPAAVLGEGDIVEIRVFREPDLAGTYRINEDGELNFPMIGKLKLEGKTVAEVVAEIQSRLADGYLRDPEVDIFIKEVNSRKVHVLGQVNRAGTFNFEPGMTVVQAVTNAGGFTKLAAVNSVTVTRVVNGKEQTFKLAVGDITSGTSPNFELWPRDIVFVPESLF